VRHPQLLDAVKRGEEKGYLAEELLEWAADNPAADTQSLAEWLGRPAVNSLFISRLSGLACRPSLIGALATISRHETLAEIQAGIVRTEELVADGASLSEALDSSEVRELGLDIDELAIRYIQAGERGGVLQIMLRLLAEQI